MFPAKKELVTPSEPLDAANRWSGWVKNIYISVVLFIQEETFSTAGSTRTIMLDAALLMPTFR